MASAPWLLIFSLLMLFGTGVVIRLHDLTNPPLDFHPTRQFGPRPQGPSGTRYIVRDVTGIRIAPNTSTRPAPDS